MRVGELSRKGGAPTPVRAALIESEFLTPEDFAPDPKARALLRGIEQAKRDLKAAGGAFTLEEVCVLLGGISRQAVNKKVQSGAIFSLKAPGGRTMFPTLQFTQDGPLKGLSKVLEAFPSENRWMLLNFLVHPDDRLLGRRPIDLLKTGEIEAAVAAASALGKQGA